ncbi:transposable element Tcb1 transposase [Trichonephila clavipes]|nr:transposable element Tcb1 transposase [Trichonephila clavipes]
MNKYAYLDILKRNLRQSASKLGISGHFKLYQDKDPKHTADICKVWVLCHCPSVIRTPGQSLGLNPIENMWDYLQQKLYEHQISNKQDLRKYLIEEWTKIDRFCKKLIQSMSNRLREDVYDSLRGKNKTCICYAINILSQFQSKPALEHWNVLLKLLGYVSQTKSHQLKVSEVKDLTVHCYSDSDFSGNREITWSVAKSPRVAEQCDVNIQSIIQFSFPIFHVIPPVGCRDLKCPRGCRLSSSEVSDCCPLVFTRKTSELALPELPHPANGRALSLERFSVHKLL